MEGNAADRSDPIRWLSPQSDGHDREREILSSIRHVAPSSEARRAVWNGIESATKSQGVKRERKVRRRRGRRGAAPLPG